MKHKTIPGPDVPVIEKVSIQESKSKCVHCGGTGESNDIEREIYSYPYQCPHCEKKEVFDSFTPVLDFLITCTCQTEFKCYCLKNMKSKTIFVTNHE